MTTVAGRLAAFAASPSVPPDVAGMVRWHVLDTVGVAIAALPLDTSQAVVAMMREQGGAGQSSIVGERARVPMASAAFANGVLAHSLDYDDTHLPSILHPSASVVPAAFAVAEHAGASREAFLDATAAGIEICIRTGMAGYDAARRQSLFFERGQHATSICGALGAAAASARLLGLDAAGIAHALGIAVSMGSGVLEGNRAGGTVKRVHCGWAAHAGVTAAMLAARGITGPPTAFEGRFGFYQAWLSGEYDDAPLRAPGEWEIRRLHFKPYPANHFTHAAIDAAIALRDDGLGPGDVASISVGVPTPTVRTIGEPVEAKRVPATGYQAQFSGPYAVAAALHGGGGLGLGLDDFTDALAADPDRRALMQRIEIVADPECDAIYPDEFPAIVRVTTRDGRALERKVLSNRGGPGRPLSDDDVLRKFRDNATRALSDADAGAVEDALREGEVNLPWPATTSS